MTLTVSELQLLLRALDVAARRFQSQTRFYERRPDRYGIRPVRKSAETAAAIQSLESRLRNLRARRDVLEVA